MSFWEYLTLQSLTKGALALKSAYPENELWYLNLGSKYESPDTILSFAFYYYHAKVSFKLHWYAVSSFEIFLRMSCILLKDTCSSVYKNSMVLPQSFCKCYCVHYIARLSTVPRLANSSWKIPGKLGMDFTECGVWGGEGLPVCPQFTPFPSISTCGTSGQWAGILGGLAL